MGADLIGRTRLVEVVGKLATRRRGHEDRCEHWLDIARQVFQVHGADKSGRPVFRNSTAAILEWRLQRKSLIKPQYGDFCVLGGVSPLGHYV
jgi:hypothetical protein